MTRCRDGEERERRIFLALFVAGVLAGGCSSTHIVGSIETPAPPAGGVGGTGGLIFYNADAGYPGDTLPFGATESWTGAVQSYQFPSGSSAVTLSFATDPSGVIVGSITFGAGGPPPPATDPNATYPAGPSQVLPNRIVEGFPYRIAMGTLTGSELKFVIWQNEVWAGWCALQTTMPGNRSCLPFGTGCPTGGGQCLYPDPQTGASIPVSDAKVVLCGREVCVCNGGSCVWSVNDPVYLDLTLSGSAASGSASTINGNVRTVRLARDP